MSSPIPKGQALTSDESLLAEKLRNAIREVPDFPKPGINFYDITTALKDGPLFKELVDFFVKRYRESKVDVIVGMESRGFILGAPIAASLGISFVPVRKPGKLPSLTEKSTYLTEYSEDSLEIHTDAIDRKAKVVIVDDLIATGGTASSTVELVQKLGGEVVECLFLIELGFLNGVSKLREVPVYSLLRYE